MVLNQIFRRTVNLKNALSGILKVQFFVRVDEIFSWKWESVFLFILSWVSPLTSFYCIYTVVYLDQFICLTKTRQISKWWLILCSWSDLLASHMSWQGRVGGSTLPGWGRTVHFWQQPTVCSVTVLYKHVSGRDAVSGKEWVCQAIQNVLASW